MEREALHASPHTVDTMSATAQLPTHDEAAFSDMQAQPEAERQVPNLRLSTLPEAEVTFVPSACGVLVRQFYTLASVTEESASRRPPRPPQLLFRKRRGNWATESEMKRAR